MIKKKKNSNYDEVIEIEDLWFLQTYDFVIPKTHCFFANGILVHNSLEQMADKILFIYKTLTKEEGNVKEEYFINVAKNRQGKTLQQKVLYEGQFYRFRDVVFSPIETNIKNKLLETFDGQEL